MHTLLLLLSLLIGWKTDTGTVEVQVTNLKNTSGQILATIHNKADGFPGTPSKAVQQAAVKVTGKTVKLVFRDLPYGTYAVSVMHDENNNNKMDTNFIGIPKEGYGASNDAKGTMGPPKFDDAKFPLNAAQKTISIRIIY